MRRMLRWFLAVVFVAFVNAQTATVIRKLEEVLQTG